MSAPKVLGPELVCVWIVHSVDSRGLFETTNALMLFRLPDGRGFIACGTSLGVSEGGCELSEGAVEGAEAIIAAQVEDTARVLAEAGRKVTRRLIEVRSSDPAVIAERLKAADLPSDYAAPPRRGAP